MATLRRLLLPGCLCLLAAGCRGLAPTLGHEPRSGFSTILIGARFHLPTGQTRSGKVWINLEGEGGEGEIYRLGVDPGLPMLYQVEPDLYRLAPPRSLLGGSRSVISATIEGRGYRAPFPREILRKASVDMKPGRITSLGIIDVRVTPPMPGRPSAMKVTLDDSVDARRKLVQDAIRAVLDPSAPFSYRESAVSWTKALDMTLVALAAESQSAPLYKRAGP